jgi:hypothetical protein
VACDIPDEPSHFNHSNFDNQSLGSRIRSSSTESSQDVQSGNGGEALQNLQDRTNVFTKSGS